MTDIEDLRQDVDQLKQQHDNKYLTAIGKIDTGQLEQKGQLLDALINHFNTTELHRLAFELGFDYEDVSDSTGQGYALDLIQYVERHNRLPHLLKLVRRERPFLFELEIKNEK